MSLPVSFCSISVEGRIANLWVRSWERLPLPGRGRPRDAMIGDEIHSRRNSQACETCRSVCWKDGGAVEPGGLLRPVSRSQKASASLSSCRLSCCLCCSVDARAVDSRPPAGVRRSLRVIPRRQRKEGFGRRDALGSYQTRLQSGDLISHVLLLQGPLFRLLC